MKVISKFWLACLRCKEKSLVNAMWHPEQIIVLECLNCGEVENIKCEGARPTSREEFIMASKGKRLNLKQKIRN